MLIFLWKLEQHWQLPKKLNRKWIGCDLGKFAIHTSRKRLINIQRNKKDLGKDYRAFEILNVGKYQRVFFKDYLYQKEVLRMKEAKITFIQLFCQHTKQNLLII